jgi:hypothetical protein
MTSDPSLLRVVDEIFPAVFQAKSPLQRLWGEISRHHRYLMLFIPNKHEKYSQRSLTAIHLLTVQSMLMFIVALCYDLQVFVGPTLLCLTVSVSFSLDVVVSSIKLDL